MSGKRGRLRSTRHTWLRFLVALSILPYVLIPAAAPVAAFGSVDPALLGFAIYGDGVSADATVQIGTNAIVRGGLVGAKNDVTTLGGANLYGSRAGRDTNLGTDAGGPDAAAP